MTVGIFKSLEKEKKKQNVNLSQSISALCNNLRGKHLHICS